jgi:hypothetical protein
MKVECCGRLFPTITKLITFGDPLNEEEGRSRERGDNDTEESIEEIDLSSTDQVATPLDFISILPMIFNFEEGFIFDPGNTSSLVVEEE